MQPQNPPAPIQPNEETEKESQNSLINMVRDSAAQEPSQNAKVMSPDELDKADNAAVQKANVLIAEEEIKNTQRDMDIEDNPYVHSSTRGFGVLPGLLGPLVFFWNNRTQRRVVLVLIAILMAIGLIAQYLITGHINLNLN